MIITTGGGMAALLLSAAHLLTAEGFQAVSVHSSVIIYLMMTAMCIPGNTYVTICQINSQGYICCTCLCAYCTQCHQRHGGELNELIFHNCAFF